MLKTNRKFLKIKLMFPAEENVQGKPLCILKPVLYGMPFRRVFILNPSEVTVKYLQNFKLIEGVCPFIF